MKTYLVRRIVGQDLHTIEQEANSFEVLAVSVTIDLKDFSELCFPFDPEDSLGVMLVFDREGDALNRRFLFRNLSR